MIVGLYHSLAKGIGVGIPKADLCRPLSRKEALDGEFREIGQVSFLVFGALGSCEEGKSDDEEKMREPSIINGIEIILEILPIIIGIKILIISLFQLIFFI